LLGRFVGHCSAVRVAVGACMQALLSQENIMNRIIATTALVGLMGTLACPAYAVQAGANTGAHATTGYASQLPAVYPTQAEQQGIAAHRRWASLNDHRTTKP